MSIQIDKFYFSPISISPSSLFFSLLKMKSWSIFTNYIYNDQLPDTLILYLLYFIYGISKVRYNILKIQQFDANLIFFQMWRLRLRKANKCIQSLFIYYLKELNHTFSTITKKKKNVWVHNLSYNSHTSAVLCMSKRVPFTGYNATLSFFFIFEWA